MDDFKESGQRTVKREVSNRKNHLISLFNNFEVTISDKKRKYVDKVQSLISAWEQISTFVSESTAESPQPEFEALFLHTLRFVLRADWRNVSKALKTHLSIILQKIVTDVSAARTFYSILPQCHVLESVINDPWNHPVLKKIFQDEIIDIEELIDYFHLENGKVIVVRLEILLESKCEDLATRLSKACLMTFNLTDPLELELNQNEVDYITDIYLCSLYRAKNTKDLIAELKTFELGDGLLLLQRYKKQGGVGVNFNENCREARIWKCSRKVIELISSTLLANAVFQDNFAASEIDILQDLIREWASVHTTSLNEIFTPVPLEMIWKCVLIARCSMCIYPFCSFLIDCGAKEHDLNYLLRCLIRAINQNMNEIEQHRVRRNNEKLKFLHDLLSKAFLLTAELFREYRNIFKECLLTAFSLTPTREGLEKLEEYWVNGDTEVVAPKTPPSTCTTVALSENEAIIKSEEMTADSSSASEAPPTNVSLQCGDELIKIKSEFVGDQTDEVQNTVDTVDDVPATPSPDPVLVAALAANENTSNSEPKAPVKDEINVILESIGVPEGETDLNTSSSSLNETIKGKPPAFIVEVESMKIEDSIKTDLNSILRYQRHHTLTWDFEWPVLKANCEQYHEMFEKRGFDEVELKYLELDYNQFKNNPVEYEECTGIEKGYEHCVASEPEDSGGEYGYGRRMTYSSDDSDYDEDYGRKKRKKVRHRSEDDDDDWCSSRAAAKKKRPPPNRPKVKVEGAGAYVQEEHSADSLPPSGCVDVSCVDEKPAQTVKDDTPIKKKLRVRSRSTGAHNSSDSEANIDSQSENQPPDDDVKYVAKSDSVTTDGNVKTSSNNLHLLRQFRINLCRPLISEENTPILASKVLNTEGNLNKLSTISASPLTTINIDEKPANREFVDGPFMQLQVRIPKCDYLLSKDNRYLLESVSNNNFKKPEKVPSPKSITTYVADDDEEMKLPTVPVAASSPDINKTGHNDSNAFPSNKANSSSSSGIAKVKHVKPYPKTSKHSRRFAVNRNLRKKLYAASVMHVKETAEGIDDLISEIFPEFSSNGSWQTNGTFEEEFTIPEVPPPPPAFTSQQITTTLSEFLDTTLDSTLGPTSSNEATFVSSTVELTPHVLPLHSAPTTINELTALQPAPSSPPMVQVLSSYLNSMDSIDNVFSYPSNICHNIQQSLPDNELSACYEPPAAELLDISSSSTQPSMYHQPHASMVASVATVVEAPYDGYHQQQQPLQPVLVNDVYSMNVTSSYDVVGAPALSSPGTASPSPMLANNGGGVQQPSSSTIHSSDDVVELGAAASCTPGAGNPPTAAGAKPNSKLRAALQKSSLIMPTVSLFNIAHANKKLAPEEGVDVSGGGDSEAVNQILDVYRDTIDKHPELGHVPARRKRSYDQSSSGAPPKRQRRSKKDAVVAATSTTPPYSLSSSSQVQVPSAATSSTPVHGVQQVPSQPLRMPNGQMLQQPPGQPNNSMFTSSTLELPSCVTTVGVTNVSSQSYGDVVGAGPETDTSNDGSHLMIVNGFVDSDGGSGSCMPPQASATADTYWATEPSLMSLDGAGLQINTDNGCDNLKEPFLIATIYNDSTADPNNSAVCISIPEDQYSEAYFGKLFPATERTNIFKLSSEMSDSSIHSSGTQLLQSNDDLYSKSQSNNDTSDVQNIQYLDENSIIKPNDSNFENGIILNADNLFYHEADYPTEINNYGT